MNLQTDISPGRGLLKDFWIHQSFLFFFLFFIFLHGVAIMACVEHCMVFIVVVVFLCLSYLGGQIVKKNKSIVLDTAC